MLSVSRVFLGILLYIPAVYLSGTWGWGSARKKLNLEYLDWFNIQFLACFKVFLKKLYPKNLGTHTDSTVWKYIWVRNRFFTDSCRSSLKNIALPTFIKWWHFWNFQICTSFFNIFAKWAYTEIMNCDYIFLWHNNPFIMN